MALFLPTFILLVFLPIFLVSFAQDDFARLVRALQTEEWYGALLGAWGQGMHRPVLEAYFVLVVQLFGPNATAFHVIALVLHAINAYLLVRLAHSQDLGRRAAWMAGYVYGGHAALLTCVMWPSAASSVLVVTLSLLALNLYFTRAGIWRHPLALAALVLALLTRQIAVVMPLTLVILVWRKSWDDGELTSSTALRGLLRCAPYLAVASVYLVLAYEGQARLAAEGSSYEMGIGSHVVANVTYLAAAASGFLISSSKIVLALVALLFWLLLGRGAIRSLRRGSSLPLAGVAIWVLGITPMVLLVHQQGYAYYSDFALIGVALAIAGLVAGSERLRRPGPYLAILALWGVVATASVWHEYRHSQVRRKSNEAEWVTREMLAHHPTLPRGARILIESRDPLELQWITGFGALFHFLYRDSDLQVDFRGLGDPPAEGSYDARLRMEAFGG